jgi:hypothetical protein
MATKSKMHKMLPPMKAKGAVFQKRLSFIAKLRNGFFLTCRSENELLMFLYLTKERRAVSNPPLSI